jgi:hypothetical protein
MAPAAGRAACRINTSELPNQERESKRKVTASRPEIQTDVKIKMSGK